MEYRNAKHINDARIDCEINHPTYGWIPFTCDPADTGAGFYVAELYSQMNADPATAAYVPPTQDQINAQLAADIRAQRNMLLASEVDPLVSNPLRWGDLTPEQQQGWKYYRRNLLDVPQQPGFPTEVVWPTAPA